MPIKILYVDDEADIREIAGMSLQLDPDIEVREASSGRNALDIARDWQPDLILLDVMMPEMDGPMTFEGLRADATTSSIPVAFCTAKTQPSEVERLKQMGVTGIIAKPFDPMDLARQAKAQISSA